MITARYRKVPGGFVLGVGAGSCEGRRSLDQADQEQFETPDHPGQGQTRQRPE
jgi:hypothetical protein